MSRDIADSSSCRERLVGATRIQGELADQVALQGGHRAHWRSQVDETAAAVPTDDVVLGTRADGPCDSGQGPRSFPARKDSSCQTYV
jgi:hypothetical protein